MEMMYSQNQFGRPYMLAPGVPADRVAALRKAFMATGRTRRSWRRRRNSPSSSARCGGEELQAVVGKLYALPANVIERAKVADLQAAK